MTKNYALSTVKVKDTPLERFSAFLRESGKRLTDQRRAIVEQVFSHHDHFDVEELLDHLREEIRKHIISRPTVYRTLIELVEAGLLRKMPLEGRSVYEHEYGYPRHDHLLCQQCNKLIEFQTDQLDRICQAVAKEHKFELIGHRMFVMGICSDCRKRR